MRSLVLLLAICAIPLVQAYRWRGGSVWGNISRSGGYWDNARWGDAPGGAPVPTPPSPAWLAAWSEVASLVAVAPANQLVVKWPNLELREPNTTVSTGKMKVRPSLSWPAEQGALYTVMIVDGGIERVLPKVYLHWMVTDIPGNAVEKGNEVMEYVTPFSLEIDAEGNIIKDPDPSSHPMILLVFKQPGPIIVDETQAGCTPDITGPTRLGDTDEFSTGRIHDYRELATKYALELVAGNFIQVPWSGFHTQQMLCMITRCTREAFPFPMPGINDLAECQTSQRITDMTIVGPKADKQREYIKWRSLNSLDSIPTGIQNLFPTHSTGKVANFVISEASVDAPIFSNNQAEVLDGIIDISFFQYPNATRTIDLIANLQELVPAVGPEFFSTLAGGGPLKIVFSQPEDQDFDFTTVLKTPEMLMDLLIVKTAEGKEGLHHAMREKLVQRVRNSKNAVAAYKFDVDQDIFDNFKGSPLYYDPSNNDIIALVYKSAAHRQAFQGEISTDPNIGILGTTFTCIMCGTLSSVQRPEYYGPFL